MVKFKKSIAMLLAVALMISCLPLSVFAAGAEPASTNACRHLTSHLIFRRAPSPIGSNENACVYELRAYAVCDSCGHEERSRANDDVVAYPHSPVVYSATCNGRVQTHYMHCINCSYSLGSKTVACPNAPHTGDCIALPASVDIPAEKY